jgi:hypothetical protein
VTAQAARAPRPGCCCLEFAIELFRNPDVSATLVLLVGPRRTGKSSVALGLAAKLHRAGAHNNDRIVAIGLAELPGFGGSYGPSENGLKAVSDRIHAALDGTLLIDDLDWITAAVGG